MNTGSITLKTLVALAETLPRPLPWRYGAVGYQEFEYLRRVMREQTAERRLWPEPTFYSFYGISLVPMRQRAASWMFTNQKLWFAYVNGRCTERVLEYLLACGNQTLKNLMV